MQAGVFVYTFMNEGGLRPLTTGTGAVVPTLIEGDSGSDVA